MKRVLSAALALALTLGLLTAYAAAMPAEMEFTDWEQVRRKEAVTMLTDLKLVSGYDDGTFRPGRGVTRAESAKMICGLLTIEQLIPSTEGCRYPDAALLWAAPYIEYCAERGIFSGSPGSSFRPQDGVTLRELAKMLLGVLGWKTQAYTGARWAAAVDADATAVGLYEGIEAENKGRAATREETCLLINNALKAPLIAGYDAAGLPIYDFDAMMEPTTLVQQRFNAVAVSGVVQANAAGDLRAVRTHLGGSCIHLSGYVKDFLVPVDAAIDEGLLGHRVRLYAKLGSEVNEAITAPELDPYERSYTTVGIQSLKDLIDATGILPRVDVQFFRNGAPTTNEALTMLGETDVVTMIDHEGDGLIDVIFINKSTFS